LQAVTPTFVILSMHNQQAHSFLSSVIHGILTIDDEFWEMVGY